MNLVEAELDVTVSLTENGRPVRPTKREVLAEKKVNDSLTGECKAQQALFRAAGDASEPENPTWRSTLPSLPGSWPASLLLRRSLPADRAPPVAIRCHGSG